MDSNGTVASITDSTNDLFDQIMPTGILHATIGEEIPIILTLTAQASGRSTADVGHTLGLLITPLGDFLYSTASGALYVQGTAVPEPGLVFLIAAGVFVIGWSRRGL
jgi:hypothetical protein